MSGRLNIPTGLSHPLRLFAEAIRDKVFALEGRVTDAQALGGRLETITRSIEDVRARIPSTPTYGYPYLEWRATAASFTILSSQFGKLHYIGFSSASKVVTLAAPLKGAWVTIVNPLADSYTVVDNLGNTLCTLAQNAMCFIRAYESTAYAPVWPTKVETWGSDGTVTFGGAITPGGLTASRMVVTNASGALASNAALVATGFVYASAPNGLAATAAATDGDLLIGTTSGNPAKAKITQTANQITVTNGPGTITLSLPSDVQITNAGIVVTTTQALAVQNTTAASSGVPDQYSPAFDFIGHSWKSGIGAADRTVRFRMETRTLTGSTPTATLAFMSSVDTGTASWTDRLTLSSAGLLTVTSVSASGSITGTASVTSSSPTAGVGYATGAGGTVTQATNKSTGVTLNAVCGQITMNNAALAAGAIVSFTLTSTGISSGAKDVIIVNIGSGGTANSYAVNVTAVGAGTCQIQVQNISAGSLSEALVLNYAVIKAVTT